MSILSVEKKKHIHTPHHTTTTTKISQKDDDEENTYSKPSKICFIRNFIYCVRTGDDINVNLEQNFRWYGFVDKEITK